MGNTTMRLFWIVLAAAYALSPVDLFPEALLGGWGWLEDLVILFFLWRYLRGGGSPMGMFRQGQRRYSGHSSGENNRNNTKNSGPNTNSKGDDRQGRRDPYEVLGVTRQSDPEEIKTAYRELVAKYHPDKVQHLGTEFQQLAETRFKEIQEAYRQIGQS